MELYESLCRGISNLRPTLCGRAQAVYDEWDEEDEEYGGGGICHLIAEEFVHTLSEHEIESFTMLQSSGAHHVFVIAYNEETEEACVVDINPYVYEEGAGYSWSKIPDVVFTPKDVQIDPIDFSEDMLEEY